MSHLSQPSASLWQQEHRVTEGAGVVALILTTDLIADQDILC